MAKNVVSCVMKDSVMRTNVAAPETLKNLKLTQFWLTAYFSYWFALIKILSCSIYLMAFSDPHHFHICPMLCLSFSLLIHWSLSLSLSSPSTHHSVSPIVISYKYSTDLMRWYHCNKLIESKRLFHLGIAHNMWQTVGHSFVQFRFFNNSMLWRLLQILIYFVSWLKPYFHWQR